MVEKIKVAFDKVVSLVKENPRAAIVIVAVIVAIVVLN